MFSPEFMRFLINYQKSDFTPAETKKEMQTIINNNQINIIDSTITKSDIG